MSRTTRNSSTLCVSVKGRGGAKKPCSPPPIRGNISCNSIYCCCDSWNVRNISYVSLVRLTLHLDIF